MTLIIGGRAQGKRAYALSQTGLGAAHICDGGVCPFNAAFDQPILARLHLLVRRLMQVGQDARQIILNGAAAHPGRPASAASPPIKYRICQVRDKNHILV